DDEERSADLAVQRLTELDAAPRSVERVRAMVVATAGHIEPDAASGQVDPDTALLLDADLSILGAPGQVYDAYARGVRAEHAEVPDERFAIGRAAVLRTLLDKPELFHTPAAQERFNEA